MASVVQRLFSKTKGNIRICDPNSGFELSTRDFGIVTQAVIDNENLMIDATTETGEGVAVFIAGNGHAMCPPPSIAFDEGGLYLNNGTPFIGQGPGELLIPSNILGDLEDVPYYSLADLKVRHVEALERPNQQPAEVDPKLFAGRSPAEKAHLIELNERCAIGLRGNSLCVISQTSKNRPPNFLSLRDAQTREATRVVYVKGEGGGTQKKIMFNEWREWPGRREYDDVRFAPGNKDPKIYNLFFGWDVDPRPGVWQKLKDHIHQVICNGNDEQFVWFMTWIAHIFQHPGSKPSVAVVIRGRKGTGKSIVFDFLQQLMRSYFYKIADGRRALGNFNAQYETTLLLLLEETFWAGDQAKEAILKDLITSPTISIERKGLDSYMANNYMRLGMISNERWVVPASEDERRFAMFDCSDKHRGDVPYFKAMIEEMNNGGLEAMLYDLLTYEPAVGWDSVNTAPITSGLKEQVVESLQGIERFWHSLVKNGMYECEALLEGGIYLDEEHGRSISMKELRKAARDYLADHYHGKKLATYDLVELTVREWCNATVVTKPGFQNDARWVEFPSLVECRAHIRRVKGLEIDPPTRSEAEPRPTRVRHLKAVTAN